MVEIVWSDKARSDLKAIVDFLGGKGASYAVVVARKIYSSTTRLVDYPDSGRIVPELDETNIRELICDGFRVIYRRSPGHIEVLTILHGHQQFPTDIDDG